MTPPLVWVLEHRQADREHEPIFAGVYRNELDGLARLRLMKCGEPKKDASPTTPWHWWWSLRVGPVTWTLTATLLR
jgi:hypothetical protein